MERDRLTLRDARSHSATSPDGRTMEDRGYQNTSGTRWRWAVLAVVILVLVIGSGVVAFRRFLRPVSETKVEIADVSSERLLGLGSTVGFASDYDTHAWLGLPYAEPPINSLRWRAPRSPGAWADTLDALQFGPPCVQLSTHVGGVPSDDPDGFAGSEDCLYLNIWAPRSEQDRVAAGNERLPVMVWIHGGGNRTGHSGSSMYDGARLSGTENVVVVSFNYRLGPFGWFSHPALRASAANGVEASGNFGTLDQLRALEWIQSNIEEFGGDPENVTIFGESSGGQSVLAMLLVKEARGLFHRAIVQSGSTDSVSRAEAENEISADQPGRRHSSAEIAAALLEAAGIVPDLDAARGYAASMPDVDLSDFLRGRSAREILEVYRNPDRPGSIEVPALVRDGVLLPGGDWITEYREGRFNRVPIILGTNRDEMKLYLFQNDAHVRQNFGIIFRIKDSEDYERRARFHSEMWSVRGVSRPASAISGAGVADVFAYRFDWDELPHFLGADLSELLGAAHGFEIPFVFGTFDLGDPLFTRLIFNPETAVARQRLSEQMMSYWAEFARHGKPGRGGQIENPEWKNWIQNPQGDAGEVAELLLLDTHADGGIRMVVANLTRDHVIAGVDADPDLAQGERCELFHDLFSWRPGWDDEMYRGIGRVGCAGFPQESFE